MSNNNKPNEPNEKETAMTKRILMIGWRTEDATALAEAVGWQINRSQWTFTTQIGDTILYLQGTKEADAISLIGLKFDIILRGPLHIIEAIRYDIGI